MACKKCKHKDAEIAALKAQSLYLLDAMRAPGIEDKRRAGFGGPSTKFKVQSSPPVSSVRATDRIF